MSFTCPTCSQTLESIKNLQDHERRYHPKSSDIQIKCERCKKMFSKTANLKAHNLRFHSDKRVKSDISSISSSENMNTSGIPTKYILIQDDEVENNQVIDRNYNSDLMMLAEVQRRNTAMIKENSLQLLKILNIVNSLVGDVESSNMQKPDTKKHECKICNLEYKNSQSLASHRYRSHPYKAITDWSCKQCNVKFGDEGDLFIHNYRFHRSSL